MHLRDIRGYMGYYKFGEPRPPQSLCNLTRPDKSLLLQAPLAKTAGGLGRCKSPVFTDTADPDYQAILARIAAAGAKLADAKRFDMPGFRPMNREYSSLILLQQTQPPVEAMLVHLPQRAGFLLQELDQLRDAAAENFGGLLAVLLAKGHHVQRLGPASRESRRGHHHRGFGPRRGNASATSGWGRRPASRRGEPPVPDSRADGTTPRSGCRLAATLVGLGSDARWKMKQHHARLDLIAMLSSRPATAQPSHLAGLKKRSWRNRGGMEVG